MTDEKGRLINDRIAEAMLGKNRSRPLAASTRVEIVTVEIEQHDPCALDSLEQRVESDRVEPPGIVKFVEAAEGSRRGRNNRVHVVRGIGCHQREKGAEGLSRQNDSAIPVVLEPARVVDEAMRALGQSVAVP